jgi:hypothetical protein
MSTINVPIGPAKVEFGSGTPIVFDITKGGIQFQATTNTQGITIDQYGDTPVKTISKGGTAQVVVPFALHDLDKLAQVIPNSTLSTDALDATKKKLVVKSQAGSDLTLNAKKLVVKPTDVNATPNDWITLPFAVAIANIDYTYNSDSERVANVTFAAYPDVTNGGILYVLGDETVA